MTRGQKRATVITLAAIGAVLLLVIGGIVGFNLVNQQMSPAAAVREYVQAIADGNADRANELVDPNVPSEDRGALSNEMLASATERIQVVRVEEAADSTADERSVEVAYRLGGVEYTTHLAVEPGDRQYGVFDSWRITTPLALEATVGTNVFGDAMVGSLPVTFAPDVDLSTASTDPALPLTTTTFRAYPAIYPVAGPQSEYYTYEGSRPVLVAHRSGDDALPSVTGYTASVPVDGEIVAKGSESLRAKVEEAIRARIDECAKSTDASPDGCPFSMWGGSSTPVTWSVLSYPTVDMQSPTLFETDGGTVQYTFGTGPFTSTYTMDLYETLVVAYVDDGEVQVGFSNL